MVEQRADSLSEVFHALADPTRRSMLRRLALGQFTIGELAAPFRMSFAGASKHVKMLERAGLIHRTVQGRTHICRLNPESMVEAFEWMGFYQRLWTDRLNALERELLKAQPDHKRRRSS